MLPFSPFIAIILFFLISSYNNLFITCLNDEGIALLSFKNSIQQDPQSSLSNWNSSQTTPCSWNGVTCQAQRVVSITIPSNRLSGPLPSSLGSLSQLRHLNLRNNNLYGYLPPDLFNAQSLQSLVLSGNSLSGPLPIQVGSLHNLQTLDLSDNQFNGSLPTSLVVECKHLRNLLLSQNNFSGDLPSGIGRNLVVLERLDLSFNEFTGSIPNDLGYLSNLQGTLDLSHNFFQGLIPSSLGNLPEKVYIDLSNNNLSGPIPQNGALINRGPTAFIGNQGLCGAPLRNLCDNDASSPSLSIPYIPSSGSGNGNSSTSDDKGTRGGLSKATVVAIVVGDVVGICVIGFLFSYFYSRICCCKKREVEGEYDYSKKGKGRKECLCFTKDVSETLSENVEQYDLIALDGQLGFDLDELLKASAFVLGKSGIGIVYKVVLEDGITLAVRRLGEGGSQRLKEFQTEVEAIGKLQHPNIVTLKAYYWSVDEKLLIYEFVPNGNLSSAIHGKPGLAKFTPIPWSMRLKIMKGVAKGLMYLHEYSPKKYVHGDLKPSNILLGHDMEPKISDFGLGRLANIAGGGSPSLQSLRMVPEKPSSEAPAALTSSSSFVSYYQAPESIKVVKPSQKWDIYSFGMILLELITGRPPMVVVRNSEMDLVQWIQFCVDEKKPVSDVLDANLGPDAEKEEEMIAVLKIAIACTQSAPERRPSLRHIADTLERL